jgi:hypothetical protein
VLDDDKQIDRIAQGDYRLSARLTSGLEALGAADSRPNQRAATRIEPPAYT